MFHRSPRQTQPIIRSRATPHLIQQHQRPVRSRIQNRRRLSHLHHERRPSASDIITRANPRINAVHQSQPHPLRRNKAAHLRHHNQQRRHPQIRTLAPHIRPENQQHPPPPPPTQAHSQRNRVRHKSPTTRLL